MRCEAGYGRRPQCGRCICRTPRLHAWLQRAHENDPSPSSSRPRPSRCSASGQWCTGTSSAHLRHASSDPARSVLPCRAALTHVGHTFGTPHRQADGILRGGCSSVSLVAQTTRSPISFTHAPTALATVTSAGGKNALSRAVCFHRRRMVRDRTFDDQRLRAGGLNLVVAAIGSGIPSTSNGPWNTQSQRDGCARRVTPASLAIGLGTHRPDRRVLMGIRSDAPTRSAAGAPTRTLTCLTGQPPPTVQNSQNDVVTRIYSQLRRIFKYAHGPDR
jgi:hypothetical protein